MKISDYAKAQGWLKRHASSENSVGEWEKYVALNTTPELDIAIKTINDKYGPGTVFPASEAPIPPMTDQQAIMEFNERNPYSDGQLVTPSVDGSRPGYSGDAIKLPDSPDAGPNHLGNGVYEFNSKKGFKTYYGKARGQKKSFGKDKEAAANFVKETQENIPAKKNMIELQAEKKIINEKKYQKVLAEMLDELDVMKEKGYGNVSNLVEKYSDKLGPTKEKTKKYYKDDGSLGGINWNTEQRKIRGAVIDAAKQADITDLPDNMIKAVEDYKKLGKEIPRGMPRKIIRANKVSESNFFKALNKINAFVKQKKKWKNIDEKKEFYANERKAALKKYSSNTFENLTKGSQTIQGGHTGDIYNEFVTPKTKKYTPAFINQETLKQYDALIKATGEARDKAIKAKNWKEVERLNVKGMALSAGSEGYKTFKVVQPDGSSYIYGIDDITTTDPADLTKVDTVQELTKGKDVEFEKAKRLYNSKKELFKTKQISKAELNAAKEELETARAAAEKKLFEEGTNVDLIKVQKEQAMKAAKLSKKDIKSLDKRLIKTLEDILGPEWCGTKAKAAADGGRIGFSKGSGCPIDVKMKNFQEANDRVRLGEGTMDDAAKIRKTNIKGVKTAGSLKALLGIWGLGGEALIEGAFAANEMMKGKSGREAWSESYASWLDPTMYEGGIKLSGQDVAMRELDLNTGEQLALKLDNQSKQLMKLIEQKDFSEAEGYTGEEYKQGDSAVTANYDKRIAALKQEMEATKAQLSEHGGMEANTQSIQVKLDDYRDKQGTTAFTKSYPTNLVTYDQDGNKIQRSRAGKNTITNREIIGRELFDQDAIPKLLVPDERLNIDQKKDVLGMMRKDPDINEAFWKIQMGQDSPVKGNIYGASDTFFGETYSKGGIASLRRKK